MTVMLQESIPGYAVGTWVIDRDLSEISFSVRHTMVGHVRGTFREFSGQIVTRAAPLESSATATIEMTSVDTGNSRRDNHLRSPDFFDIAAYPVMTFQSTELRHDGFRFALDGHLTIKNTTNPISLDLELPRFRRDPDGGVRMQCTARGELNRSDYGVDFNLVLEAGGILVADRVSIHLEIEAALNP